MKKSVIVLILVIVTACAGGFFYWQKTKSPEYSLLKAMQSFENHDSISFQKYVDVNGVMSNLIEQFMDSKNEEDDDNVGSALAKGFLELLKPKLSEIAETEVIKYVEKGNFEDKSKEKKDNDKPDFSLKNVFADSGGDDSTFKGVEYVKIDGNISVVGLKLYNKKYDKELILDLKMRKMDGYWQVSEISNFADFKEEIAKLNEEKLAEKNRPIVDKMNKSIVINNINKKNHSGKYGYDKKVYITLTCQNTCEKTIESYVLFLNIKDSNGKTLKKSLLESSHEISVNQTYEPTWEFDINQFIKGDAALFKAENDEITFEYEIEEIKFTDGSKLKLLDKV